LGALIKAGLLTPSRGGRPIALAAIALSPPCSAGVRFLPGLKAGASSEEPGEAVCEQGVRPGPALGHLETGSEACALRSNELDLLALYHMVLRSSVPVVANAVPWPPALYSDEPSASRSAARDEIPSFGKML
jgi:hypothetical protein